MNARKARVLLLTGFAVYLAGISVVTYQAAHRHDMRAVIGCYILSVLVGIGVGRAYARLG